MAMRPVGDSWDPRSPARWPISDRLNLDFKFGKAEIAEIAEHIARFSLAAVAELTRQARRS
jgi:hypothetical protein